MAATCVVSRLKSFSGKLSCGKLNIIVPHRCMAKTAMRKLRPKMTTKRRLFEYVSEPIYLLPPKPSLEESCPKHKRSVEAAQEKEIEPYKEYRLQKIKNILDNNVEFVICHSNPMTSNLLSKYRVQLIQLGFRVTFGISNNLMREIIPGTKFASLAPYLVSNNAFIINEGGNYKDLLKLLRRSPEFIPIGAYVSNRLICKEELVATSKLPKIEQMRGELVSILNLASGGKTSSLLNSHTQTLSANLEQYAKQLKENDNSVK